MSNCPIMQRMKENYENRSQTYLTRRVPVIIRIDGKAFSSLTKRMEKPFDNLFADVMKQTAFLLSKEVQGCKLAYVFSDEISLLLTDYTELETQAWFDYNLQKIVSVSAALATHFFTETYNILATVPSGFPVFDSRAFSIPKEEVCNYFIARQKDCIRNSVSALAQANFSHKILQGLNSQQLKEKLMENNINWDKMQNWKKYGSCVIKHQYKDMETRPVWILDDSEVPIFTENREYIERFL